jgi:hypothetical protein
MWLICSIGVSLFVNIIPEHIDKFVSSCYEFTNSVAAEIRALAFAATQEQPFPLPHYCAMYQGGTTVPMFLASILKDTDNAVESMRYT